MTRGSSDAGRAILLAGVTTFSILMYYGLSVTGPTLVRELDLSKAGYGSIFTVYFLVGAVAALLSGSSANRLGARGGMTVVLLSAASGFFIAAVTQGLTGLYLAVLAGGIAGGLAGPATNLGAVGARNLGSVVGVKQSGVQIAMLTAGIVLAPLAVEIGWRSMFVVCGVTALLVVPLVTRRPGPPMRASGSAADRPDTSGAVGLLTGYAFVMGAGMSTLITYLPVFAVDRAGLSLHQAGLLLSVMGVVSLVARIFLGVMVDRRRDRFDPVVLLMILAYGGAVNAAFLSTLGAGLGAWLFLLAVFAGATGSSWNGLVMSLVVEQTPPARLSRASGHVQGAFYAGLGASPVAVGWLMDRTGSYALAWALVCGCLFVGGIVATLIRYPLRLRSRGVVAR